MPAPRTRPWSPICSPAYASRPSRMSSAISLIATVTSSGTASPGPALVFGVFFWYLLVTVVPFLAVSGGGDHQRASRSGRSRPPPDRTRRSVPGASQVGSTLGNTGPARTVEVSEPPRTRVRVDPARIFHDQGIRGADAAPDQPHRAGPHGRHVPGRARPDGGGHGHPHHRRRPSRPDPPGVGDDGVHDCRDHLDPPLRQALGHVRAQAALLDRARPVHPRIRPQRHRHVDVRARRLPRRPGRRRGRPHGACHHDPRRHPFPARTHQVPGGLLRGVGCLVGPRPGHRRLLRRREPPSLALLAGAGSSSSTSRSAPSRSF